MVQIDKKTEILNIPLAHLVQNVLHVIAHWQIQPESQLETQLNKFKFIYLLLNLDLLILLYIFWIIKPHRTIKAPVAIQNKSVVA